MRSLREVTTTSPRGMITDRGRGGIAVSVQLMLSGYVRRYHNKGGVGYNERWQALASALHHLSLGTLAERVNSNPAGRFSIYLARRSFTPASRMVQIN